MNLGSSTAIALDPSKLIWLFLDKIMYMLNFVHSMSIRMKKGHSASTCLRKLIRKFLMSVKDFDQLCCSPIYIFK